ncbi:MAG: Hemolysin C [Wolbachia endosymbiont of Ctenocephalides orientis wCori]|nr:MAG: Hemolysin C [Wolbachia endosymbiont of Ctenocephalides orientis wCori]
MTITIAKLSKKKGFIEKVAYRVFLFLFKKFSVLKKCTTEALMKDLPDLNIFNSLLKFHDCSIMDIMTPRTEIFAIEIESSKQEILKKIKNTLHTKVPIYKGNFDNIVGFFYIKDVLLSKEENFSLRSVMQSVIFVPPSMRTTNLFIKMKSSKSYLAIVLDEYGGTDGLVSMTDLIEEIIPNIDNENEVSLEHAITELSKNKFEVSARALIKEIEESLNIRLRDSEEDYATIGGLVLSIADKVPAAGDIIKYKNCIKFIVKDANDRYINKIILDLSNYKK